MSSFALTLAGVLMSGCPGTDDGGTDRTPFRDEWRVAADQPFDHTGTNADGDPVAQIFQLTIGGRESNNNFANRGDVIVNFDGPADRILVEMRRFTFAANEEAAEEDYEDLVLWAYNASSVGRPQDQEEEDNCNSVDANGVPAGWINDCDVRVYFDGQNQLRRSGADLRVTLPPDYRQDFSVITQDNVEDDNYFNRGNVCISNLFASAQVETESGNVWVSLDPEIYEAPKCSPDQIANCEEWTVEDEMGEDVPAPWASECSCISQGGGQFGQLQVDNRDNNSSDITVDIPGGLWTSITAQNQGMMQTEAGDHCDALVSVPNAEADTTGNDFPWQAKFFTNYPGESAIRGAGFNIQVISSECGPVAYTESPEGYVGMGGEDQVSAERGNIEVGTGIITQTCDQLIP
ncbi:MAG: hypothetical protein AAGF11_10550 [Myxococcota bacterium]